MSKSPPKPQSVSSDRRQTSIFKQPFEKPPSVSHFPIFNLPLYKENHQQPQKLNWNYYQSEKQQSTISQKKRRQNYVELQSQNDPQLKYQFPLFTDKELGIPQTIQDLLKEGYDNDDDINTRESVMQFFVDVCKQDLLQGISENKIQDENKNPIKNFAGLQSRLRESYQKLDADTS